MTDNAVFDRSHTAMPVQIVMPLGLGLATYLLLLTLGDRLLNDSDTYWHIAVGRWMVEHGAFPHTDMFSYTMPGAPWIAKEWLSQLILAGAYQAYGWTLVVAVAALAVAGAVGLLARLLLQRLDPIPALLLTMVAIVLASPHVVARPHVLALPFMVAWVGGLIGAVDRGRPPSLALLPLMTLWANLHGGFTLGLALIVPLAADALWSAARSERRRMAIGWTRFAFFAFLAACVTPYGAESILVTYRIFSLGPALHIIGEWLPQDFGRLESFEVLLLGAMAYVLFSGFTLPPLRIFMLLGLLHLALAHVRNGEILGLLGPLLIAAPLAKHLETKHLGTNHLGTRPAGIESRADTSPLVLPALAALCIVLAGATVLRAGVAPLAPRAAITPAAAVEAIQRAGTGPVFNDYDFGAYLIRAGIPTFIDGRTELYGGRFMARHHAATTLENLPDLLKLLDEYRIGATLLAPSRPAVALLDRLPGWKRIHSDAVAVVHMRIDTKDAAVCQEPCAH